MAFHPNGNTNVDILGWGRLTPEQEQGVTDLRPVSDALEDTVQALAERVERNPVLNRMNYAEFLKTPEWQETRRAILKRAGYRCERCGAYGRLNVHHETYARRGYEDLNDLEAICVPCHEKEHGIVT